MIYLDTSFIVPRYIEEASSETLELFLSSYKGDIAISYWTYVEFSSMLARRLRMKEIDESDMSQIMAMFEHDMRLSFQLLVPHIDDYELASYFLQKPLTGLRAGDALHLAIAHHAQVKLYTLDKLLIQAAQELNVSVGTLD